MSNVDGESNAMDGRPQQQQQQQPFQSLGLLDLDVGVDSASVKDGYNSGGNSGGNFPFPLTDQASLFNFHTPSGLGIDPLYSHTDQSFVGSSGIQGLDSIARISANPASTSITNANDLAMDIALLDTVARADPLAYATASSLLYGRGVSGTPTSTVFPGLLPGDMLRLPQQPQMTASASAAQDATTQIAARVRAARARILNNVLYNMSLGGIQQLDGSYNGSIATPLGGLDDASTISNPSGMNRFLADVATSNALDMPVGAGRAMAAVFQGGIPPAGYQHGNPYQVASPLSQTGLVSQLTPGTQAAALQQPNSQPTPSFAPPRIDQACKMCRRRKVRCDGLRPSCTFCQTKRFECVYEPVAPGGRKRSRRSKISDSGSVISSNVGGTSITDYTTGGSHRGKHVKEMAGRQRVLPSIRSASGGEGARSVVESVSDADDEHGYRRQGKQRRFDNHDMYESPEGTDADSSESSASEGEHGYLDALSNRQIALPDNVGSAFSIESILESRADLELAEGVAAATLASIAGDARNNSASIFNASSKHEADGADGADVKGTAAAAVAHSSKDSVAISHTERSMQLYFDFFHPQHPILHRHSFEKAVHEGTVNKVLWQAVQAIAARYGPAPTEHVIKSRNANTEEAPEDNPMAGGDTASQLTNDMSASAPASTSAGGPDGSAKRAESNGSAISRTRLRPFEYGKRHAELVRAMLPEATKTPTIEVIQALYLLSEHQFGMGDWLEGSTYWGTAVRMFNQLQLHMTDESFQFPAYTSHLGLHESAISPLTCKQSPANYASEMRKPTLNNESWIKRELERRMRWALFESERMHTLAGGNPPLVTLEAGWVHMPCSDAIWDLPNPRRAAEYERLMLHMGRYYVDTGGSLRIDMAASTSAASSQAASMLHSANESPDSDPSDSERNQRQSDQQPLAPDAKDSAGRRAGGGNGSASGTGQPLASQETKVSVPQSQQSSPLSHTGNSPFGRRRSLGVTPNRVASMLVSVRRRKNRIHLNAHTAIVIGQMTRARLALFRLFFPCRWPSQLMSSSLFGAGGQDDMDLGGGGGAPGPIVLSWEERFRRMRITIADIESKLVQWRVYLESMFPLREHEEGSGRTDEENRAIHRERVEYANYRFMLAALIMQNRSTVLQLQACLARRERKIRHASQEPTMGEAARQTLANHVLPNQPSDQAMKSLRQYGQECWNVIVRQACEIEDLLESHWQVRPHSNSDLQILTKPDWHAPNAIKAKINAETNLRKYPEDEGTGQREVMDDVKVFFSHETPPYPLLVVNHRLLEAVVKSANSAQEQTGAELTLASSMNTNIHIETNANARDMGDPGPPAGRQQSGRRKSKAKNTAEAAGSRRKSATGKRHFSGRSGQPIRMTPSGEVDFESADDEDEDECAMDPFRMQLASTSYFIFLAAKTMIMYLHHAKMSAYILARRRNASSENGDNILPSSSVSVVNEAGAEQGAQDAGADTMLLPDFMEDLSPPPMLRTLSDIRRMQDRLEIVMTALKSSQKYWMSVDYFVLCARKLRNMSIYGPWSNEDPVSTDISAELANEAWPPPPPLHGRFSEDFSSNVVFST